MEAEAWAWSEEHFYFFEPHGGPLCDGNAWIRRMRVGGNTDPLLLF